MEILEDNGLFKKLGLVKKLDLELNCSINEFRNYFRTNVGEGQTFIGIKRPNKEFQGSIGRSAFKIQRSLTTFDSNLAGASGVFSELNDKLRVGVWVYLPIGTFIISYTIILVINILTAVSILSEGRVNENIWPFILVIVALFAFSTIWPYLAFRNWVTKLTFDLEREISYWTIKQTPHNTVHIQWRGSV